MRASNLIVYPTYNTQPIKISERSTLYSLEPQGLRTALVESLTSYIQRLALAHCVQPGILITKMCVPLIERNSNEKPSMSFGSRASRAFNGTGSIALKTVNIIQTLTARSDLSSLTLLPFAQAIPSVGVFRLVEAWCPICLSEWRDADHEIYTPLLWTFTDIKVCLQHSCLLHEKCQHCGESWNLLGWRSRPGYCSRCAQWLGQANSVEIESTAFYSEADQSFNNWAATHIGKLLASSQGIASCTQEKIISSFTQCIDVLTEGNRNAFSRLVNKNPDVITKWHLGIKAPSLRAIMEICHYLNLSLLDFLTGNLSESLIQTSIKFSFKENSIEENPSCEEEKVKCKKNLVSDSTASHNQNINSSRKVTFKAIIEEKASVQSKLEAVLLNREFKSVRKIADELRMGRRTLYRHFPDLCNQIDEYYFEQKEQQKIEKEQQKILDIRSRFEQLIYKNDYPPDEREAARILHTSPETLRRIAPDLCKVVATRRAEHRGFSKEERHTKIKTLLESALDSQDEPPPSLAEIARLNGYNPYSFWMVDKELCKSISLRYLTYQKKIKQQRINQACEEIEAIATKLHEDGIYPSKRRVSQFLSVPSGYFREPEVTGAWKRTLEKLGYENAAE